MHPTLVRIPFVDLTIWSFGAMAALGALMGFLLVRRMTRRASLDLGLMSDAVLYGLVLGMVGARAFFVLHRLDEFRGDLLGMIAIWRGGLEFVGGVIPAVLFVLYYLRRHQQPVRRYFDILAVGLMMGLAFGRVGCFLNGCCYGKPTDLPWGVRFPYRSYVYNSQINADPARGRAEPHLPLPAAEYAAFIDDEGRWYPMSLAELTPPQRYEVTKGEYRCRPIHPTQLYASVNALLLCAILYVFWRRSLGWPRVREQRGWSRRPGFTTAAFLMLYGVTRFVLESLRDDNPFELAWLTISQILGLLLLAAGMILLAVLVFTKPSPIGQLRVIKQPEKPRRASRASGGRPGSNVY